MLDLVLAMFMALLCILVHFEALVLVESLATRIKSARVALLFTWSGLLVAHVFEIWMYAVAYYLCDIFALGEVNGASSLFDYAYYSAVVYTTLGFGDLVPSEGVRMLTGSEALVGLSLIAWSATVTYSRVQLHRDEGKDGYSFFYRRVQLWLERDR